jgi:hypothetical protein
MFLLCGEKKKGVMPRASLFLFLLLSLNLADIPARGQVANQEPVCDDTAVAETQSCVAGLKFPAENSAADTVCDYLEMAFACFVPACCTDVRYERSLELIGAQVTAANCESARCGDAHRRGMGLSVLCPVMAAVLVVFLSTS